MGFASEFPGALHNALFRTAALAPESIGSVDFTNYVNDLGGWMGPKSATWLGREVPVRKNIKFEFLISMIGKISDAIQYHM